MTSVAQQYDEKYKQNLESRLDFSLSTQKNSQNNTINLQDFRTIPIDYSWSFSDKTQKDTAYITHSYYTYPAKFIPQLTSRLIKLYSKPLDLVLDPFMGSGTTMVETLVHNRRCAGVDINQIAYLVAKVKTTPLDINLLKQEFSALSVKFSNDDKNSLFFQKSSQNNSKKKAKCNNIQNLKNIDSNERIDYWFKSKQKRELKEILTHILGIENKDIQDFYLVAFAQILKTCSIWLQKSIKPTRDLHKKDADCYTLFLTQAKKMIKKHEQFNQMLDANTLTNIDKHLNLSCGDSRCLPLKDNEVQLIITSPPYVTSYEYADLHQLPSLWLGFLDNLSEFRKKFIGSSFRKNSLPNTDLQSKIAQNIITQLKGKKAIEVQCYYADMLQSFAEMYRVLKPKSKACIVIGNTEFRGVEILNAEVFAEQMQNLGFKMHDIIHREIPSKMLPSTRDSKTGRFAKTKNTDKLVYPTEYILIMEKQ
ncbi:DNA methyltransferase [Helicobacter sp. T3_23-1059]